MLLEASDCSARTEYVPLARGDGTADHDPLEALVLSVCTRAPDATRPSQIFTVIVGRSPLAVPAAPEIVGVESRVELPSAGLVILGAGGVVSGRVTTNTQ
jgi:hypothetical protein